jgi:hypothetical protein
MNKVEKKAALAEAVLEICHWKEWNEGRASVVGYSNELALVKKGRKSGSNQVEGKEV